MFIANSIFFLNILLGCVSYNKLRSIALKLEIELVGATVENIISKILCVEVKSKVLSAEYKELIYKKV